MRSKSKEAIILMAALCDLDNIPSVPKTAWINIPVTVKGKNRPCPCGSGKKYKLCCLGGGREDTQMKHLYLNPWTCPECFYQIDDDEYMSSKKDDLCPSCGKVLIADYCLMKKEINGLSKIEDKKLV